MKSEQTSLHKWIVRGGSALLLLLPFLVILFVTGEIFARINHGRRMTLLNPCWGWIDSSKRVFSRYFPNCQTDKPFMDHPVRYRFNIAGFRDDRQPSDLPEGGVVVLGDSITKGVYLNLEETIPAVLEAKLTQKTGLKFFNAGIRFTGPTAQSHVLRRVLFYYRARGVIWNLNPGDVTDERLYNALATSWNSNGFPMIFSDEDAVNNRPLFATLAKLAAGRSVFLERILLNLFFQDYRNKLHSVEPTLQVLCAGIRRVKNTLARTKLPLIIVLTPHPVEGIEANWGGEKYDPANFQMFKSCIQSENIPLIDLSEEPIQLDHYVDDKMHLSAKGVDWITDRMIPTLKKSFIPQVLKTKSPTRVEVRERLGQRDSEELTEPRPGRPKKDQ